MSGVERGEVRNKEDTPFLKYNVDQLDLEYKLRKQREHQNRLKYMEVQLPAFNSRLPRLV